MSELTSEQAERILMASITHHKRMAARVWLWTAGLMLGLMIFWGYTFKKEVAVAQELLRQAMTLNGGVVRLQERQDAVNEQLQAYATALHEYAKKATEALEHVERELLVVPDLSQKVAGMQHLLTLFTEAAAPERQWRLRVMERLEHVERRDP